MTIEVRKICATIALSIFAATASQAAEPVTLVADEWPPFSGNDLPGKGLAIDVTRTVLERAGYEVQAAILPWARIVDGAKTGEYDITTSLFADVEMEKYLHYAEPFYTTEVRFIRRKGEDIVFDGLESLQPYSIAVGSGFLYEPGFDAAEYLNKFEVTTTLQGIQMLAAGHVDLTLDSADVLRHSMQLGGEDLEGKLEMMDPPVTRQDIHMAVSRSRSDHTKIVEDFNRVLREMKSDGSLATLLAKHDATQAD